MQKNSHFSTPNDGEHALTDGFVLPPGVSATTRTPNLLLSRPMTLGPEYFKPHIDYFSNRSRGFREGFERFARGPNSTRNYQVACLTVAVVIRKQNQRGRQDASLIARRLHLLVREKFGLDRADTAH